MANNNNSQNGSSTQAPTYVFITGANPDVKLPSFQFGGFDPSTLQFGSIKALPAPSAQEPAMTEESFPPLVSAMTAAGLSSRGKRPAVVIPKPAKTLSRKVQNGKVMLTDTTTIYRGQPLAVKKPKTASSKAPTTLTERVSVFNRLSFSKEVLPTKHQHQKINEDDFDLKFVPGSVMGPATSKSRSRNARRRAAKRARASASNVHSVNVVSQVLRDEHSTIPTSNSFEALRLAEAQIRVTKKKSESRPSKRAETKTISGAIYQAVQRVKALRHTSPQVFAEKKKNIMKGLVKAALPRALLSGPEKQDAPRPAYKAGGRSTSYKTSGAQLVIHAPARLGERRTVTALPRATVHTCYMTGSKPDGEADKRPGVETRSRAQSREQTIENASQSQDMRGGSTGPLIPPHVPNTGVGGTIILPPPQGETVLNSPDEVRELRAQADQNKQDYLQSQARVAELVDLVNALAQQVQITNQSLSRLENERNNKNSGDGKQGGPQPSSGPVPVIITPMLPPETEPPIPLNQEELRKFISDSIRQEVKHTNEPEGPSSCTPYAEEHNLVPYPPGFIQPNFTKFKGSGDPTQHVNHFVATCGDIAHNQSLLMRQFSRSLEGIAFTWYAEQRPGTFLTWNQMKTAFMERFGFGITDKITLRQLSEMKPSQGESISNFIQRWRNQSIKC